MSKPIGIYPESQKKQVAYARVGAGLRGLGYWGAVDYINKVEGKDLGDYSNPNKESTKK